MSTYCIFINIAYYLFIYGSVDNATSCEAFSSLFLKVTSTKKIFFKSYLSHRFFCRFIRTSAAIVNRATNYGPCMAELTAYSSTT